MADLRQTEEEDWAMEGSMHVFKVIRMIGQMLTDQAYMHLPGVSDKSKLTLKSKRRRREVGLIKYKKKLTLKMKYPVV